MHLTDKYKILKAFSTKKRDQHNSPYDFLDGGIKLSKSGRFYLIVY